MSESYRTNDLFHAMEWIGTQFIEDTALTDRRNRQKRPNGRYLLLKCCQIQPGGPKELIVWNQPSILEKLFSKMLAFVSCIAAQQKDSRVSRARLRRGAFRKGGRIRWNKTGSTK